jgi:hypothetical protein
LNEAKNDILIVTSSKGLVELEKKIDLVKSLSEKGISIKIMAPITYENLDSLQILLNHCQIRHTPVGYIETTIIDDSTLFQFSSKNDKILEHPKFKNLFYTNDIEHIKNTKKILFDIWKETRIPSTEPVKSILTQQNGISTSSNGPHSVIITRKSTIMQNMEYIRTKNLTEKDIIKKIQHEKKFYPKKHKDCLNNVKLFGSRAFAIIHTPTSFNLPNMILGVFHHVENSTFGAENILMVNLWKNTEKGGAFIPVAYVQDNKKSLLYRKKILAGFPAENNIELFNRNQLQVKLSGKTLFAGWTKPIPLGVKDYVLPPAFLLFEGYGEVKPGAWINTLPSGCIMEFWYNYFDAFVSFFLPNSKYIGTGTEGFLERDSMLISRPSQNRLD